MRPELIAKQLSETGLCVCADFLSQAELRDTRDDLDAIHGAGRFERAGTGRGQARDVRDLVRRDEIHWLERVGANPVQAELLDKLAALKQALNRTLFLGLRDFEGHYSAYPKDGFYKRHLDCFQNSNARVVSVVIYLNRDWTSSDGGRLRVYQGDSHVDIDPVGATLVCFLSRESEHEVLPSLATRFSFTGWFTA